MGREHAAPISVDNNMMTQSYIDSDSSWVCPQCGQTVFGLEHDCYSICPTPTDDWVLCGVCGCMYQPSQGHTCIKSIEADPEHYEGYGLKINWLEPSNSQLKEQLDRIEEKLDELLER